ncbi:MAG: acyl-CoA synthetase [Pseudomonadales bacterium]
MSELGFWNLAQAEPDKLALIDPQENLWTRGQLLSECNQMVHGFRSMGLQVGDTVAIIMPNCKEFLVTYLACAQAGFYLVPINWHLAGPEVAYILADSEAKAFISHEKVAATAKTAVAEAGFPIDRAFSIGAIDGFTPLSEFLAKQVDSMPDDMTCGAVMNYTSGTTGRPKGVKRALAGIDPNIMGELYASFLMMFGIQAHDNNVHFTGSPLYHTAVLVWAGNSLHLGHSIVLVEKWDAEDMLRLIDKYQVTTSHMVPTQFVRALKLPQETRDKYDCSSTRHMIHAAAPCPPEIKKSMIEWWGPSIYEYYAATEGGGTLVTPQEWLQYPGTVGKAWPGAEIKIFDDEGQELPVGETGTVYMLLQDAQKFEYKGDKAKTDKERLGNYFTVGDVGYLNEEGYLFLCDRKIDMIISGGANIYPAEIESELILHPSVADCTVFGIPNEDWGEEIKAVVQTVAGVDSDEALSADIMSFLERRIARMKLPRTIDYMAELPRDENGKLYKRRLKDPYWQGHEKNV